MHEFLDTEGTLQTRFGATGSPAFSVKGLDLGRDWAGLGYGIDTRIGPSANLFVNDDLQFNDRQTFYVGSGGLQLRW